MEPAQSGRYTRGPEEEDARRMSVAAPPATASETERLDALARDIEGLADRSDRPDWLGAWPTPAGARRGPRPSSASSVSSRTARARDQRAPRLVRLPGRRRPGDERRDRRPLRRPGECGGASSGSRQRRRGDDRAAGHRRLGAGDLGWGSRRDVDLVDVRVPSPILAKGLTLVDTPVGGLNAGHAVATLAFLPSADALVFVTDASAELSAAELEFRGSARAAGPPVLVALSKIDMYPEWRRTRDRFRSARRCRPAGAAVPAERRAADAVRPRRRERLRRVHRCGPRRRRGSRPGGFHGGRGRGCALGARPAPRTADGRTSGARRPISGGPAHCGRQIRPAAVGRPEARRCGVVRPTGRRVRRPPDPRRLRVQREMRGILRDAQAEVEAKDPAGDWPEISTIAQDRIATAVRGAFRNATTGPATSRRRSPRCSPTTSRGRAERHPRSPSMWRSCGPAIRHSRAGRDHASDRATAS